MTSASQSENQIEDYMEINDEHKTENHMSFHQSVQFWLCPRIWNLSRDQLINGLRCGWLILGANYEQDVRVWEATLLKLHNKRPTNRTAKVMVFS